MDDTGTDTGLDELIAALVNPATNHEQRAHIGELLDSAGDVRPGVGLTPRGLPDIEWLPVPGGMADIPGVGVLEVEPFYIARYPLTHIQCRAFIEAPDGYANSGWWYEPARRDYAPPEQPSSALNQPAVNLSWFDALALCRWLTAQTLKLPDDEAPDEVLYSIKAAEWEIRLPTEWEWQMAATGGDPAFVYPWGRDPDTRRAHTAENGLVHPVAVGLYPDSLSPIGVADMAGGVWEWCLNAYDDPTNISRGGSFPRAIRGGSWWHYLTAARTISRESFGPQHRFDLIGVRLACCRPVMQDAAW